MKSISFLSRFTIICNVCFFAFAVIGMLEKPGAGDSIPGVVEKIPYLKELIIILGFPAIVINFIMCLAYGILLSLKKGSLIPKWLSVINVAFLIIEVYYFFLM